MVFDVPGLLPPPSPCSYKKRKAVGALPSPPDQKNRPKDDSILFVSPHTTASLSTRQGSHDEEDYDFSGRRFHPVSSFEEKSKSSAVFRSAQPDRAFFSDAFRNPDDRKGAHAMNCYRRITKDETDQQVGGSFDCNDMDVLDWNDPLLAIMMKPSIDQGHVKLGVQEDRCVTFGKRLTLMHNMISDDILANPPSEQGPLVSMVANWAKAMAKSPLLSKPVKLDEVEETAMNHDKHVSSFAAV
jgi:hypothetical protein